MVLQRCLFRWWTLIELVGDGDDDVDDVITFELRMRTTNTAPSMQMLSRSSQPRRTMREAYEDTIGWE